ncbi:MAG: YlbE-like family protein [Coprobacillaceae bacterium]
MNNDLVLYLRQNPRWYIILSREPERISELQEIYKQETNQTFLAKVEQLSMVLNMMELLL